MFFFDQQRVNDIRAEARVRGEVARREPEILGQLCAELQGTGSMQTKIDQHGLADQQGIQISVRVPKIEGVHLLTHVYILRKLNDILELKLRI